MFKFGKSITAKCCDAIKNNATSPKLWKSFTFGLGEICFESGEELTLVIGNAVAPVLEDGSEYAISVSSDGVAIRGRDENGLLRGFSVLCLKIEYTDLEKREFYLPDGVWQGKYALSERMIHFCVFPETTFSSIRKYIRLAGVLQYTHVIIEFWGMFKFDCLDELSWDRAFTKDEARQLVAEARSLGCTPVPMFNQLGHATASRQCYGKHVVLDQNPSLQDLFLPDGWSWNICSEKVFELLKNVRKELCEVFGDGEYFHIGCDEAYMFSRSDELRAKLPAYLKRLTDEVVAEGRRPIMWVDMLLPAVGEKYYGVAKPEEAKALFDSLNKKTVVVDWQYDVKDIPLKSTKYITESFGELKTVGAPWFDGGNIHAHIETAKELGLDSVMLTTWHTLTSQTISILFCAKKLGASTFSWACNSQHPEETATLLRRVAFEPKTYEECGWREYQVEV